MGLNISSNLCAMLKFPIKYQNKIICPVNEKKEKQKKKKKKKSKEKEKLGRWVCGSVACLRKGNPSHLSGKFWWV
jgi:hypothetical protein